MNNKPGRARRFARLALLALGLTTVITVMSADLAKAHFPDAHPTCSGLDITASDYGQGYTLTGNIDGQPVHIGHNGWSQDTPHVWVVSITAPDWDPYSTSGTSTPCITTTTAAATTTAPATTTTQPEVTTTADEVTTTEPPITEPATTQPPETSIEPTLPISTDKTPVSIVTDTGPAITGPADPLVTPPTAPDACIGVDPVTGYGTTRYFVQPCHVCDIWVAGSDRQPYDPTVTKYTDLGNGASSCTPIVATSTSSLTAPTGSALPATGATNLPVQLVLIAGALMAGTGLMLIARRRRSVGPHD